MCINFQSTFSKKRVIFNPFVLTFKGNILLLGEVLKYNFARYLLKIGQTEV